MSSSPTFDPASDAPLEADLAALEQRLAALVAHVAALRAANETLRRDLASAQSRNHVLADRVAEATRRLDALLARFPEPVA
jgi:chromosome segregation ATPase